MIGQLTEKELKRMYKQYFQIGLSQEMHKNLKRLALEKETSMSKLIEQALKKEFGMLEQGEKEKNE